MKSVIKTNDLKGEIKYPCLMTGHSYSGATVVLFTKKDFGTVVHSESKERPIGYHSEAWIMAYFTPFDGTIELSNN